MSTLNLLSVGEMKELVKAFESRSPEKTGMEPHLAGVLREALSNPGSLTRAQLSYKILRLFGDEHERALNLACGIEYFHTASLILDDLPCMDDGSLRRGKACVHRVQGEAAAILGSLALITRAYALIWDVINACPWHERVKASEYLEAQIGTAGILNGQSLDIHFQGQRNPQEVAKVALGKTVSLINLALVFPAMLGGADSALLEKLEKLAFHWGMAYQAMDDIKDVLKGPVITGKTGNRDRELNRPNMVLASNIKSAQSWVQTHLDAAGILVRNLNQKRETKSGATRSDATRSEDAKGLNWKFLVSLQEHMEQSNLELLAREPHVA